MCAIRVIHVQPHVVGGIIFIHPGAVSVTGDDFRIKPEHRKIDLVGPAVDHRSSLEHPILAPLLNALPATAVKLVFPMAVPVVDQAERTQIADCLFLHKLTELLIHGRSERINF